MNTDELKKILDLLENYSFSEFEYEEGSFKIKLGRTPAPAAAPPAPAPAGGRPDGVSIDFNALSEVKTPVAGVFYEAPAPDAPPFVKVGDKVKKGDILCIVEAMKTMNEILSDFDGEVTDCCVSNGQFVEYNQVLFKIF